MEPENLSVQQVKKRFISSFLSLGARQVLLRSMTFLTLNVIVANILPPSTIGIFNIAQAFIVFFVYFSDVGLAASLIQKKEAITESDIKTTFTVQQILIIIAALLIIASAPYIGQFYGWGNDEVWLVRILGLSFFFSSLKVIPSVMLERNLNFKPLVIVEVVENLLFNILLIYFAFNGYDIWSFTYAAIARGIVGVFLIYLLAPVKIGIGIHAPVLKQLLSFGVPFQLNSFLALIKDRLVPLVVAKMIGDVGMGYVTWSQSFALLSLEVMNIMNRITFPAFSRMQEHKEELGKMVDRSLFLTALMSYPMLFGLAGIMPSFVGYVINPKWQPALLSFYFFAFSVYWSIISTTFTNTLNALGRINTTLKLMVFWTIVTWLITPALVYYNGFIGVSIGSFLISFSSVITIFLVKRVLTVKVIDAILVPTVASLVMALSVFAISGYFVRDWLTLILAIVFAGIEYAILIFIFARKRVIHELRELRGINI